jgi:histidinol-phosphate aminotransferase
MDIQKTLAKHVQKLVPYQSARRIGGHGHCFLNANESPKSESYLLNSLSLNRYPDCQPEELIEKYADYVGVRKDRVLCSRGSDEAIGLIIRTFIDPDEGIVTMPPTYGMYEVAANTNNVKIAHAKRREDFTIGAQEIEEAVNNAGFKVKAVFIDSPANPLGIVFDKQELVKLLNALPDTFIVLDEAYVEFARPEDDYVDLLKDHQNLIITRTLSKAFALAGIRCGFTLADPEVVKSMLKVIDPYPVCDPVAQIAIQALSQGGLELMQKRVEECNERRRILTEALQKMSAVTEVFASLGNFVLVRFKDGPAVFNAEAQRGVILRSFEDKPRLKNCVRISVGSKEELDECLRNIEAFEKAKGK